MNDEIRRQIEAEALAAMPNECCGYVVRSRKTGGLEKVSAANLSSTPQTHGLFSPSDSQKALVIGQICATYHSHPAQSLTPSDADIASCDELLVPFYIYSVPLQQWFTLLPKDLRPQPYEGREFCWGVHDCFELGREYFKREHGILIRPQSYREAFWKEGQNKFLDGFAKEGFSQTIQIIKSGDVLLFCVRSPREIPNHCAIYVGNNKMLHHLQGRLSCVEQFDGYWQKILHSRLRHYSLC